MGKNDENEENSKSCEKILSIYKAIKNGEDEACLDKLLQTEGDLNHSEGPIRVSDLLDAAFGKWQEYFNLLLTYGADFTCKNEQGQTVVHAYIEDQADKRIFRAAELQHVDLVLDAQVKFKNTSNPSDANGSTHLHAACMRNNYLAVEFFLKSGVEVNLIVNVDSPYFPSYTPLHFAVEYTCPDALEQLLKQRPNVHLKNADGLTPLHLIIKKRIELFHCDDEDDKFNRILTVFAKYASDELVNSINSADEFGFCKIHFACVLEDQRLIELVLKQTENINRPVNFNSPICPGYTALHLAALFSISTFKLLLRNGANIEAKNERDLRPLDFAFKNFSTERILWAIVSIKRECSSIILSDKKTKLTDVVAAMDDQINFGKLFKYTKSNVFVPMDSALWPGYTLLHIAVIFRKSSMPYEPSFELIDECLRRGCDLTVQDAKGATGVHLGFYMQRKSVVAYLLDRQATRENPVDQHNLSHFHIACAACHFKSINHFLPSFFAKIDVNSKVHSTFKSQEFCKDLMSFCVRPGCTALHISVAIGNRFMAKNLLKHGADVNAVDEDGFTPVHRLLFYGFVCFVSDSLLSAKNLRNIVAPCALSHLHVACHFGHFDSVKKLLKLGADINAPLSHQWIKSTKDFDEFIARADPELAPYMNLRADYSAYTPMHFAWHANQISRIFCTLMENNGDMFAMYNDGTSILNRWLKSIDNCIKTGIEGQPYCRFYDECFKAFSDNAAISRYLEQQLGISKLHVACCAADVSLVANLLRQRANINAQVNCKSPIWHGLTPLHCIIIRAFEKWYDKHLLGRLQKIIGLLMQYGADVLKMDSHCDSPFHLVKLLYGKFCSFNDTFNTVVFPFFSILFKNISNFNDNPTDNHGLSVFHVACMTLNVTVIKKFIEHGVNVNEAIGKSSDICPGSTPLQLIINHYNRLHCLSVKFSFEEKTFLQTIDLLLETGGNVNLIDADGNTLLIQAVQLTAPGRILINKFISKAADIFITNNAGDTAFSLLLKSERATWHEIELFLKTGFKFNTYHAKTQEGYMALFLHCYLRFLCSDAILKNQFLQIINDPNVIEINDSGRTALHNVVSVLYSRQRWTDLKFSKSIEASQEYYAAIIKQLLIRGCDIDDQDHEGKTALHAAAYFANSRAIGILLKNGADISIIDKNGKTAFSYCYDHIQSVRPWDYREDIDRNDHYPSILFAKHVYKLKFCRQHVNQQDQILQTHVLQSLIGQSYGTALDCFHDEINKAKTMTIGNSLISLYEFLLKQDMDLTYTNMTTKQRQQVDQFYEDIDNYHFCEIDCLLKLKYRKTIEIKKLMEPALAALSVMINAQIPELCCRNIFKYLRNEDLKRLIASAN